MSTFKTGDPVIVDFQGVECQGEVIRQSSATGYVMARIAIEDPEMDMGSIGARLDPQPVVCVPESRVRAA
jgi:hypothetical protein